LTTENLTRLISYEEVCIVDAIGDAVVALLQRKALSSLAQIPVRVKLKSNGYSGSQPISSLNAMGYGPPTVKIN
jgi:hypothetical protein